MARGPARPYPKGMHRSDAPSTCSFCGVVARRGEAVVGPDVIVCGDCLTSCDALVGDVLAEAPPPPAWFKDRLDRDVVGHERAKRQLSVAVHTHIKRLQLARDGVELGKSNVLLIGPTGSGKTHLVLSLAKALRVPVFIGDATSLTEAGYVGEDVESLLLGLLTAADDDLERARRGILYIDEIDKLGARNAGGASAGRDVGGEGVQQALLKLIEGREVTVSRGARGPQIRFDTSQLLVICGGAFEGLDAVVARRLDRRRVGFGGGGSSENLRAGVQAEDLHRFGLIPEFLGRLPVLAQLDPLDEDALVRILTEPRDALVRQYQRLFALDGVDLTFSRDALRAVAREALERGTGARALRGVLEELLLDAMFEVPTQADVISVRVAVRDGRPAVLMQEARPLTG